MDQNYDNQKTPLEHSRNVSNFTCQTKKFDENANLFKSIRHRIKKKLPVLISLCMALSISISFETKEVSAQTGNGNLYETKLVSKYRVKPGDTLYKIATKFNTTVSELRIANRLTSNRLLIGQMLTIPNKKGRYYLVESGDTLYKIAGWFNLTINQLKVINGLTSDLIYVKQTLYIPHRETITVVNNLPNGVYHSSDRGPHIQNIQTALNYFGYALDVDGIYGPTTRKTILDFQSLFQGLSDDGIYGPKTKAYLQQKILTDSKIVFNPRDTLALVNKHYSLPPDFVPQNLVVPNIRFLIKEYHSKKLMRQEAATALEALFNQANSEQIYLFAVSGYRPLSRQRAIFSSKAMRIGMYRANQFSAKPGESEHQTGLAMDVTSQSAGFGLTQSFGQTKEGIWLKEHAPDFGFIIRYPKGKEHITGYEYEPWHLRYVGKYAAKRISDWNITFEAYLGKR